MILKNILYVFVLGLFLPSLSYADQKDANNNGIKVKAEDFLSSENKKNIEIQNRLKSLDGAISFCSGQMDASNRLSCFENVARDEGVYVEPVSFKEKKEENSEYQWSKKTTSDISKQKIVITGVETNNVVDSFNPTEKNTEHAYLSVRCKKGDFDLYISYDKEIINKVKNEAGKDVYPTKPFTVNINIGGEQRKYPFFSGNSGHSIGLWGSENSESLIKYINNYASNSSNKKEKITTNVDLGDKHYIEAAFSIINMYNNLNSVLTNCHVK